MNAYGIRVIIANSIYRTYEELKCLLLSALRCFCAKHLPYLWGIEIINKRSQQSFKLGIYRTYEELKSYESVSTGRLGSCIYRTYEELKFPISNLTPLSCNMHLPYLWGIEITGKRPGNGCWIWAFTVPMRNWNMRRTRLIDQNQMCIYRTYEELKYFEALAKKHATTCIYRTYEELKSSSIKGIWRMTVGHLPYLWGIEIKHRGLE